MTPQEFTEDEPFEPGVPVYKVAGKVLAGGMA